MRLHLPTACALLLAAALESALGSYLPAASVTAAAGGNIGEFNNDGETVTGNGSATLEASGATVFNGDPNSSGSMTASSRAGVGLLGATAELGVTNVFTSPFNSYGHDAQAGARASFIDEWLFTDRPLDTRGTLRLTARFEGTAAITALGATTYATAFGSYFLNVSSLGEFNNPVDFDTYQSGPLQLADVTIVFETDFLYGRSILVQGDLNTSVQLDGTSDFASISGEGYARFGNTASLTKLEVLGTDGRYTSDFTLSTLSGGTYPFQATVPEPSTSAIFGAGVLAVIGLVARRRRPAPLAR